jgi:hypothetical protein
MEPVLRVLVAQAGGTAMLKRVLMAALVAAGIAAAQDQDPPSIVGRLSYVQGSVSFQPGGVDEWVPATVNRPLTTGDQIFSDEGSYAEVHIPGVVFRLGSRTAFQFLNLNDQNIQARLSEGPLIVRVSDLDAGNLEIDTPNLAFTITRPGDYRIETHPDTYETYVTVRNGEGQVLGNGGSFTLHPREQAVVSGQDQDSRYQIYEAPGLDAFDEWSMNRDRHYSRATYARYVSPSVVGAEDLDDYGDWRPNPEYGNVWIPRAVPAGWAPYQFGHWAWIDPWGWTWVDDSPWGFAPFHYGRWAYFGGTWGWVPGPVAVRPVYAPALVAWFGGGGFSIGVGFGGGPAIGWFPLGPRDVYIPAYRATPTYVSRVNITNTTVINNVTVTNVYNNYIQRGAVSVNNYQYRTVPGAIAVVPQTALVSARPVQQVVTRVTPAQVASVSAVRPAPPVAPQMSSVLGRAAVANAPRPAPAVVSRPVVAKSTPPPPPPPFQQRAARLVQDPGRPLPIQEQRQIATTAAVPTAPVRVVAQAPVIAPQVNRAPAPAPGTVAQRPVPAAVPQTQARPAYQPPASQPVRVPTPPQQVGRPVEPAPVERPTYQPPAQQQAPARVPAPPQQVGRPYEPPSVQRPAVQPPAAERYVRPSDQPPVERRVYPTPPQQVGRPYQGPPPKQEYRTAEPQRAPQRSYEPPPAQRHEVQPPPERKSEKQDKDKK